MVDKFCQLARNRMKVSPVLWILSEVQGLLLRLLATGFTVASISAAIAAPACGPHKIADIAVATVGRVPVITVTGNGLPLSLILDTGAARTVITPTAAERIKAQPPRIAFQRQMRGIAGSLSSNEVELRSFALGSTPIAWRRLTVAPVTIKAIAGIPFDGLLGADVLSDFDIDLDLPQHRMTLYEKQSCPNAAPAWSSPFAEIATGRSLDDHLFFPVRLDDREVSAFIDTGAETSTLSTRKALAFGVTEAALARDPSVALQGAAAGRLTSRRHRFARLQIGSELVRDPELAVVDFNLRDADIILGIDVISAQRFWLSYGSLKLFIMRR